ncbi:MAG TPA: reverse transcriptase family protein [Gemmataceae bacterium]|nr:reverse transcriptase family protein [Gemmataceae bacterium]
MDPLEHIPSAMLRPLPANATSNKKLRDQIDLLGPKLPDSMERMGLLLEQVKVSSDYDAAVNRAAGHVWSALEEFYRSGEPTVRVALLRFAHAHLPEAAQAYLCRRLVKDSAWRVRSLARRLVERSSFREVALPLTPDGAWDATGWLRGTVGQPLFRHRQGRRILQEHGLPVIKDLAELRKQLGIKSPSQLGYFLLATDQRGGPYSRFTIPKRGGGERVICAPKKQLRWVQRRILDQILANVAPHPAAHGFIAGRSTVTNAEKHRGAALLVKFDLTDFFPTIHYHRVVGLFASLGYYVGDGRFGTEDDARRVAPTLARLCCYAPDPQAWGGVTLPQGAPTSPAISNLVCRRLDARLEGLAHRNQGTYTRYADDLTFSFKDASLDLGRFRWWVDQVCQQEGFLVNQAKFRVIRASQRQLVTGIVVNDELRIPREERRRFRAVLHNCRRHGLASQARGREDFSAYLRGFASYVQMVCPDEGAELLRQVEELLGPEEEAPEETA